MSIIFYRENRFLKYLIMKGMFHEVLSRGCFLIVFDICYYSGNKISKIPSFRRKPESTEKTGCRIKACPGLDPGSGMTSFDMFTCQRNKYNITERKNVCC